MTARQEILKLLYPIFRGVKNLSASNSMGLSNRARTAPLTSFYSLHAIANDGTLVNFGQFRAKKILLVNTASDCGYTGQYRELQKLHKRCESKLCVLGFPANDFKEQENGADEEIGRFCKINYGVTFTLFRKSSVIKGNDQNEVYRWLSDKNLNGWNDQEPTWNFAKYLVNEEGFLMHFFPPYVSPLSKSVLDAIEAE